MTISEVAKKVVAEGCCHLIRIQRCQEHTAKSVIQYDARPWADKGHKRGWTALDLFTASALNAVHNALNEKNRARWDALPLPMLLKLTWANVQ